MLYYDSEGLTNKTMSKKNQNVDYQLDLTPFISLLSVCICFLLLTVAWFQIGALSVKQVMGEGSASETAQNPTLWVYTQPEKNMEIRLKKGNRWVSKKAIPPKELQFNWTVFNQYILNLKKQEPLIEDVFIYPQPSELYEDIIKIMDGLRQAGLFNMGLSPL